MLLVHLCEAKKSSVWIAEREPTITEVWFSVGSLTALGAAQTQKPYFRLSWMVDVCIWPTSSCFRSLWTTLKEDICILGDVYYTLFSHTTWKQLGEEPATVLVWGYCTNRNTGKEELKNKRNGGRRGGSNSKIKPSWVHPPDTTAKLFNKSEGPFCSDLLPGFNHVFPLFHSAYQF